MTCQSQHTSPPQHARFDGNEDPEGIIDCALNKLGLVFSFLEAFFPYSQLSHARLLLMKALFTHACLAQMSEKKASLPQGVYHIDPTSRFLERLSWNIAGP